MGSNIDDKELDWLVDLSERKLISHWHACSKIHALVAEVRRLRAEFDVYIDEDQTRVITLQRNIIEILRENVEAWEWYEECRKCLEWLDETCCSSAPFREAEATFLAAREAVHADRE